MKNDRKVLPTYYSILTAEVRYSELLSPMEKIIYSEITALSSATGKCWATNQYFADLFKVEPTTVSEWINSLKKNCFVTITGAESKKRVITLISTLRKKPKVINEPKEKTEGQPTEKAEHNNTSSNNKIIPVEKEFSPEEYFKTLTNSNSRFVKIIAVYSLKKKKYLQFHTKKQCDAFIYGRNIRVAKRLVDFSDKNILDAMRVCEDMNINGKMVDWSLETVEKQINK